MASEKRIPVKSTDEALQHIPASHALMVRFLRDCPPYSPQLVKSSPDKDETTAKWSVWWEIEKDVYVGAVSLYIAGKPRLLVQGDADSEWFEPDTVHKAAGFLFDSLIPFTRTCLRVVQQIDEAAGPLAVRLRVRCSLYTFLAGYEMYFIRKSGLIEAAGPTDEGKLFEVKDRIPVIIKQLEQGFPYVTRGPVTATTMLYVYDPVSSTRCPREDVIAHFKEVIEKQQYEPGTADNYRHEMVQFKAGDMWCGWHKCEGKECDRPRSECCDLHLVKDGKPTFFVTNSLCAHYLEKHWDDAKKQVDRLIKYLAVVGIAPIE